MLNNLINQRVSNLNKTVNRIIKNFQIFQNINVVFCTFQNKMRSLQACIIGKNKGLI